MADEKFNETCKEIGGTVDDEKWDCDVQGQKFLRGAVKALTGNNGGTEGTEGSDQSSEGMVAHVSIFLMI